MVFSTFTEMVVKIINKGNEILNIDYQILKVNSQKENYMFTEEDYNWLKNINGVDKVYKEYNILYGSALIPTDKVSNLYKEDFKPNIIGYNNKKFNIIKASIDIYDSERLNKAKAYVKQGTIDEDKLNAENGVILVVNNILYSKKLNKTVILDIANLKEGDNILIDINNPNQQKIYPKDGINLKVMAVLKRNPFGRGFGNEYAQNEVKIITTKEVAEKIANKIDKEKYKEIFKREFQGIYIGGFLIQLYENANRDVITNKLRQLEKEDSTNKVIDVKADIKERKRAILQMMVFLYGFIVVIALIGSLNIINTVSTNMILRKREFSVLKAIGMDMRQIKKMVIAEGVLYGLLGSIYGLMIGMPLSYLLYNQINTFSFFPWTMPWNCIIIAITGAISIGLLSIIIPLKRIKNDNIIECIRIEE
ncbi:ABC transporter permease [Caloranaerobacter azorensis]|uniref:ABC transporter permease n=1 Tax=Caloranaerobacter azorensis TaxID=116090 RepID=A0A6P1YFJ6_9FIRM|nr:ABC transporter permease [Caloranaerobacter azorensis]QIB27964.1 ABC transporter permease [Caloranaerobacter azorensis]